MFNNILRYGLPAVGGTVLGWVARGFSDRRQIKAAAAQAVAEVTAKKAA